MVPITVGYECRVDGSVYKIDYSMAYIGTVKLILHVGINRG
jgi:hypothetical protein